MEDKSFLYGQYRCIGSDERFSVEIGLRRYVYPPMPGPFWRMAMVRDAIARYVPDTVTRAHRITFTDPSAVPPVAYTHDATNRHDYVGGIWADARFGADLADGAPVELLAEEVI